MIWNPIQQNVWQTSCGQVVLCAGDALDVLSRYPDQCVNCIVTSPPYWGLRDYGTAAWEGGDETCDHLGRSQTSGASTLGEWKSGGGQRYKEETGGMPFRDVCGKCGAKRIDSQIGLEATPEEYADSITAIFREARRLLTDDGTLWLNLGDTYCSTAPETPDGLKPKDLVGIPWRVAFALQRDGWYLRQDIIWHKPNPMPESVRDRCTKAHEYLFLMSKSPKYHYDHEAIKEPSVSQKKSSNKRHKYTEQYEAEKGVSQQHRTKAGLLAASDTVWKTRNRRSVWSVGTRPYKGAHFATFPPALIEPCILAGCPAGGIVLDPFIGSGTTAEVAVLNGRSCVGIDLNPEYLELAQTRIQSAFERN